MREWSTAGAGHLAGEHARLGVDADLARARELLDAGAAAAVVRSFVESAAARLALVVADDEAPEAVRRAAEGLRAELSSHLLAATAVELAGGGAGAIRQLLRRAVDAPRPAALGGRPAPVPVR